MDRRLIVKQAAAANGLLFTWPQRGAGNRGIHVLDADAWRNPCLWIILWTTALVTRLLAAFLLPNAEQDGFLRGNDRALERELFRRPFLRERSVRILAAAFPNHSGGTEYVDR